MAERFLPSKIANAGSFNFPDFFHFFAANFFASIFPIKYTKMNSHKKAQRDIKNE
jgi:hypothetical protein